MVSWVQAILMILEDLFEDLSVMVIGLGAVHWSAGDVVVLTEDVGPAVLVAAGEACDNAALGQVVEDCNLLGAFEGVPGGEDEAQGRELDALGSGGQSA